VDILGKISAIIRGMTSQPLFVSSLVAVERECLTKRFGETGMVCFEKLSRDF